MTTPLLTTKLHVPPPRPRLVPRPRLFERWTAGLGEGCRLTLVSAPAGFGKTTLLAEWARLLGSGESDLGDRAQVGHDPSRSSTQPPGTTVAWLSLDDEDDEPIHFWTSVVTALQTVCPEVGKSTAQLLRPDQRSAVQAILTPLLNEISDCPERIILFLDDYHCLSDKDIHDGLAFWLDHHPPNCHTVVATRADPPLPTFRWRARGELIELRSDDLRFTAEEVEAFLNEVAGLALEPEDVEALDARTEGWIAGLQLAALALKDRRASAREFISAFSGSHRYVLEYLTGEVVLSQPGPVQEFLIQTSILDRLCGPLCDTVMHAGARAQEAGTRIQDAGALDGEVGVSSLSAGRSSRSKEMLDELERRNLFLVPLDDVRHWYRYHHLFAELLRNLLRNELSPEGIMALHRRASRWFERQGDLDGAIQHAQQAGDHEHAASLIERAGQGALSEGRLSRLLGWFEALPAESLLSRPRLGLYRAWALHLSGQSDSAAGLLEAQRDLLRMLPPSPGNDALRGEAAALLTAVATVHGNMPAVEQEGRQALAYLPEEDHASRARVLVSMGTAYAYGDETTKAMQTWRQARDLAEQAGNPFLAAAAIELLAGTQVYQLGHLRDGAEMLQEAIHLGTAPDGSRLPLTGTSHALLAEIQLEWNNRALARRLLQDSIELMRLGGIGYSLVHPYCTKARLDQAVGDTEGALEALRSAQRALGARPLWHMIVHLASCQVRFRLWQGDIEGAGRWARLEPDTIGQQLPRDLPAFLRVRRQIAVARVCLAQGVASQALATLERSCLQAEEAAGRTANLLEILLVRALALAAQGRITASLQSLDRSLTLAEPHGYVRLFLEEGEPLGVLLREAAERGRFAAYAERLLRALPEAPADGAEEAHAPHVPPAQARADSLIEPLTPREFEVLQLICEGLSNREISQRLTVTLNTVKKHSSNLYGKLGVASRAQAIIRARELGLC